MSIYALLGTQWNTLYPDCVKCIHTLNGRGYAVTGMHWNALCHCFQLVPGIFTLADSFSVMVRVSNSVSASVSFVVNIMFEIAEREVPLGPYKPRTGQGMNHAQAILAAPAVYCIHGRIIDQATGRQTVPNVNEKHAPSPFGCHSKHASAVELLNF